ncbi:MAG: hypothetical protein AAF711_17145 [Planctomycetota bacterium]
MALLTIALAQAGPALAKGFATEPSLTVQVDGEGLLKIYWYTPKLDQAHAGFILSRAEVQEGATEKEWEWSPVGEKLFRPDFRLDRLERLELDEVIKQRPELEQPFVNAAPDEAIAMILKQPEKEFQKLQLAGRLDIQVGIALGTAWIDHEAERGKTYAYRVHTMHHGEDGRLTTGEHIGQQKIKYEVNAIQMPELESFEVERTKTPKSVRVHWSIKAEALKDRDDLRSFKVIAGDLDAPLGTTSQPVRFGKKSEDGKLISFSASMTVKSNDEMPIMIQPRGSQGSFGPPSKPFILQKLGEPLGDIENFKLQIKGKDVVLTWDYEAKDVGTFAGFSVVRRVIKPEDTPQEQLVPDLLATDKRQYTDKGAAEQFAGEKVHYFVRAMSSDSRKDSGSGNDAILIPHSD